jgi:hypothetical protein
MPQYRRTIHVAEAKPGWSAALAQYRINGPVHVGEAKPPWTWLNADLD